MPRNLVVCCDGTDNQFGLENTNVVRLVQMLDREPTRQRVYYDPGVGTLPEPNAFTWLSKKLNELFGLMFGAGLAWKVQEAYSFLMEMWEPGDRVYLFGFSRGAYTVRVLAGMLHSLGLLSRGNDNLVPYAMRLFKSLRGDRDDSSQGRSQYWDLCNQFRWTFARKVQDGDDERRFRIHFLGVWDTVSSVGWVWDPERFPFTARNPGIDALRHAVSIDERRWFFRQNLMERCDGQDFDQQWYPGVHSDVGGGYPAGDSGLWRGPLDWITRAAESSGLLIDPARRRQVLDHPPASAAPWDDLQHESLTALWWPAEFFPKLKRRPGWPFRVPTFGLGRHRTIPDGALISLDALRRLREKPGYDPPNLAPSWRHAIRELPAVTGPLEYRSV